MDSPLDNISCDEFKEPTSLINSQINNFQEKNRDYDLDEDSYLLKELLLNSNLCHKNLNKVLDFGINKTTYGPYECSIQFGARYFINIIREYYLKLNCERINFIVNKKAIYIYSHIASVLQIITKINTHYMSPKNVILLDYNKELKANFNVLQLIKNLELHNFSQKDIIKISFKIFKNTKKKSKNEQSLEVNNPFYELAADINKFEREFNFDEECLPGLLIVETGNYCFSIDCNYAPIELCSPPNIPEYILHNYIFFISIDKISNFVQKINFQSPIEISCNKYICNFIVKSCENFLMFNNEAGAEFMEENFFNFFKLFDRMIERGTLYKKMITFTLDKQDIDALRILNKNEALLYFYADNKEIYYYSKETDDCNNITSAVFLKTKENKPLIKDIEDCCLYEDHWEDWLEYLSSILPRDCINDLKELRKNKGEKKLVSNNKNNRKKKNKNEEDIMKNDENENKVNDNIIMNVNVVNGENHLQGINLYVNDRKGNLSKIKINENNKNNVFDIGRGKSTINKQNKANNNQNKNENIVNPFCF